MEGPSSLHNGPHKNVEKLSLQVLSTSDVRPCSCRASGSITMSTSSGHEDVEDDTPKLQPWRLINGKPPRPERVL